LVCVNDQITLSILCWKLFGFLKRQKVHGIVMSLPERLKYFKQHHWLIAMLSRMLNKATTIFNLSNYVQDHFIKDFSIHESTQVKTLYFGIDVDFWKQQEGVQSNFVLSIGNDMNRDFKTLIEAIPQTQTLKIVSNKKAELGTKDVEFITGLTNDQVREKYNQALFVVIPSIKLDKESSGLSSCLQAMACKKAVIISDAPPLRELFKDYEHCLFYVSEDVVSLQEKITLLLSNPMLCNRLAEASYALVQERFTCKQMGKMIESTLL
jgi:glycosyltransferase involved in cell wall biosynthesis